MIKTVLKKFIPATAWAWLRQERLRRTLARFQIRHVEHEYGDWRLKIVLADPLGAGWYDHDWPMLEEISFLRRRRLKDEATVFDLGAHQCVVALMLAKIVGPSGLVVAVEASAHNVSVGLKNKDLNGVPQLKLVHAAVAKHTGTVTFNQNLNGQIDCSEGSQGKVNVPAISIDDLTRNYGIPDVLFVDVEGYECQALAGASETLNHSPDCFIEVHVGEGLEDLGGSVDILMSFFPKTRYTLFMSSEAEPQFVIFRREAALTSARFFLIAAGSNGAAAQP